MIASRIADIRSRMAAACARGGRLPDTVQLVAVSKTVDVAAMRAAQAAGCTIVGESYVQEAQAKFQALSDLHLEWHLIGRLQRNKAKYAVRLFDLIHSLDSLKLAEELNHQAAKIARVQPILLQINVARELTKGGCHADQAVELVREINQLEHLELRGVMTIPPYSDDPETSRPYFRQMYQQFQDLRQYAANAAVFRDISMGMSHDCEVAIEEGATLIRVGTAIFGERL